MDKTSNLPSPTGRTTEQPAPTQPSSKFTIPAGGGKLERRSPASRPEVPRQVDRRASEYSHTRGGPPRTRRPLVNRRDVRNQGAPQPILSKTATTQLAQALDKWASEQGTGSAYELANEVKINVAAGLSKLRVAYDGTPPSLDPALGIELECVSSAEHGSSVQAKDQRGGFTLHERLQSWVTGQPDTKAAQEFATDLLARVKDGFLFLQMEYKGTAPPFIQAYGIQLLVHAPADAEPENATDAGGRESVQPTLRHGPPLRQPDAPVVDATQPDFVGASAAAPQSNVEAKPIPRAPERQAPTREEGETKMQAKPKPRAPERDAPTRADAVMKMQDKRAAQLAVHVKTAKAILRDRQSPDPAVQASALQRKGLFEKQFQNFLIEGGAFDVTTIALHDLSALKNVLEARASSPEYQVNAADRKLAADAKVLQRGIDSIRADLSGRIEQLREGSGAVDLWRELDGTADSTAAFMRLVDDMPAQQRISTFIAIRNAAEGAGKVEDPVVNELIGWFGSIGATNSFAECASSFDQLGPAAQQAFSSALTPATVSAIFGRTITVAELDTLAKPFNKDNPPRQPDAELAASILRRAHAVYNLCKERSTHNLPPFENVMVARLTGVGMEWQIVGLLAKFDGTKVTAPRVKGVVKKVIVAVPNPLSETAKVSRNPFKAKPVNADEVREFHALLRRAASEMEQARRSREGQIRH